MDLQHGRGPPRIMCDRAREKRCMRQRLAATDQGAPMIAILMPDQRFIVMMKPQNLDVVRGPSMKSYLIMRPLKIRVCGTGTFTNDIITS